jgi:hypothetical protein
MAGTWPGPGARRPFELKLVFAIGLRTIGFGAPRGKLVAAEIATTRPSLWSSWPSSVLVFPGRSWPKKSATKTVSSASLVSPSFVMPIARGAVP